MQLIYPFLILLSTIGIKLIIQNIVSYRSSKTLTTSGPWVYKDICQEFYAGPHGHNPIQCTPFVDFNRGKFVFEFDDVGGPENATEILVAIYYLKRKYEIPE